MDALLVAIGSAFWLGILTSVSPCPLVTNIAAVSYIGKRLDSPRKALLAGLLFTLGRLVTYVVLGVLLVSSLLAVPEVAIFLQRSMNKILGPLLVLLGLVLLNVIRIPGIGLTVGQGVQQRAERWGIWGAGLLGLVLALSFCPVSAGLFFGALIPLAAERGQPVILPIVYGLGTALPVVGFAVLLAFGVRSVGVVFNKIAGFERWATRVTGAIMLAAGGYYVWQYLLR